MYALFKPELLELARTTHQQHALFEGDGIPAGELNNIQLERLKHILRYVKTYSPFYRNMLSFLHEDAIDRFDWNAFRKLPFTTKNDLREAGHNMVAAPLHKAWIYYETTGTTGAPTPCPRNEHDSVFNNAPLILRYSELFRAHGQQHIVGVMGPTELHSTGDTFEDVCRSLGHTVVKMWPRSPVVGLDRAVTLIRDLKITTLVCTPAMAISLARHLIKKGQSPFALGVKLIFTLGELTTPALLRNIGDVWGCAVYNCMYASQESSILAASDKDGNLCTVPLNVVYEVVNPLTGQVLEPENTRMTGELVITHLYLGQKPLIRYRTGDMVRAQVMNNGKWQVIPIGRVKDALAINGHNHCAYDVEAALFEHLKGCLDYHIQVETVAGVDQFNVTLELEQSTAADNDLEAVASTMEARLGARAHITVGSTDAVTGTAAMVSWKAARLHDKRNGSDNQERETALKIARAKGLAMADVLDNAPAAPCKPHPWVYLNGQVVAAAEALVPVTTQAFNYGTAVFEGIRAYVAGSGELNVFRLDDHLKRLENSARLLQMENLPQNAEMKAIILDLLQRNEASTESYIRPLAYKKALLPGVGFGVKLTGVSTGLAINTLAMSAYMPTDGIRCAISSWRRIPDVSLPARAKVTGSYANSALAMESAQRNGFDDALMLNVHGNLAESTTSNVFVVKDGCLITPPLCAHILEGITRDTVITLAREELRLKVIERDISFSELFSVDECFLAGTGVEIVPVTQIDHYVLQESGVGEVSAAIRSLYLETVKGLNSKYAHWLTPVFN